MTKANQTRMIKGKVQDWARERSLNVYVSDSGKATAIFGRDAVDAIAETGCKYKVHNNDVFVSGVATLKRLVGC